MATLPERNHYVAAWWRVSMPVSGLRLADGGEEALGYLDQTIWLTKEPGKDSWPTLFHSLPPPQRQIQAILA